MSFLRTSKLVNYNEIWKCLPLGRN